MPEDVPVWSKHDEFTRRNVVLVQPVTCDAALKIVCGDQLMNPQLCSYPRISQHFVELEGTSTI
jgi:hypothetical protein